MSQLNKTWLVAKWEFMHFFKWKQELISKLVMLAIAAVVFFWHSSQEFVATDYKISVMAQNAPEGQIGDFIFTRAQTRQETLMTMLQAGDIDALIVAKNEGSDATALDVYSQGKHGWQNDLAAIIEQHYAQQVTQQLGLTPAQLQQLQSPVQIFNQYLDNQIKTEAKTSSLTAIGVLAFIKLHSGIHIFYELIMTQC